MNVIARAAAASVELTPKVWAVAPGVLWMQSCAAIVAADVHFAYEDVIGAALPTWSTTTIVDLLTSSIRRLGAREIVLLGDVIHSSRMSEGAAAAVRDGLDGLRKHAEVTIVAGNHEGRTRGMSLLGTTVECVERDGWALLHGDRAPAGEELLAQKGCIAGHLHPSLRLNKRSTVPVFLIAERTIVLPALAQYSDGLDATSDACFNALRPLGVSTRAQMQVVAVNSERCFPLGGLAGLRRAVRSDNESISEA